MVSELVKQGRAYLESGQLVRAKDVCKQISAYLDYYLITDDQWKLVDSFLKEVLLIQKIAEWKEKGRPEYDQLLSLSQEQQSKADIDPKFIEKYLQ